MSPITDGVLSDLRKIIEDNGNVDADVKEKILLTTIYAVLSEVRDLKKGLERNPFFVVGDFISKNPKLALTLIIILFIITNVWFVSDIREPVLEWLFREAGF